MGAEPSEVVIRAMVRREYTTESDAASTRPPVFDTVTAGASVSVGATESVQQVILGYAEVPPRSRIGRYQEFEPFRETIEQLAHYVHWRPAVDSLAPETASADEAVGHSE